jgi:hypothetical protein
MTKIAQKLSFREIEGKAPGSQHRDVAIMDAGLGQAPLQDYSRIGLVPKQIKWDPEKGRTEKAQKEYVRLVSFDQRDDEEYKPKKRRRGKPYHPLHDGPTTRLDNVVKLNAVLATRQVDDPFSTTGGKITVTISKRNDVLGAMHSRRQIRDHQFAAGRLLEKLFEQAELGDLKAMDPTKEPIKVDTPSPDIGGFRDTHLRAAKKLRAAKACVGSNGYALLRCTLAYGMTLQDVAEQKGFTAKGLLVWFRESLDTLAEHFQLSMKAPSRKVANDKYRDLLKLAA